MKLTQKLMLLMILMTMSLKGFSQSVTDSTSIQLQKPIAKLVIKDLITGDGAKNELALTLDKILLLEQKVVLNARDLMQEKDWNELVAIYGRERTDLEESTKSFEIHRMVGSSDHRNSTAS